MFFFYLELLSQYKILYFLNYFFPIIHSLDIYIQYPKNIVYLLFVFYIYSIQYTTQIFIKISVKKPTFIECWSQIKNSFNLLHNTER